MLSRCPFRKIRYYIINNVFHFILCPEKVLFCEVWETKHKVYIFNLSKKFGTFVPDIVFVYSSSDLR